MNLKKPCYPYVVTNYEYGEDFIEYYVGDLPIKVNLIIFDKKRIYELLNALLRKTMPRRNSKAEIIFVLTIV